MRLDVALVFCSLTRGNAAVRLAVPSAVLERSIASAQTANARVAPMQAKANARMSLSPWLWHCIQLISSAALSIVPSVAEANANVKAADVQVARRNRFTAL
mgnify:CR=1 FL=1